MQRSLVVPFLFLAFHTSYSAQEKIDQYVQMPRDYEGGHLFHFSDRLKNEPGARGLIVINKPRVIDTGRFLRRVHGIRDLIISLGTDRRRLDVYAGEERDRMLTRIWLIHAGEKPPVFGALSLKDLLKEKITKRTLFDSECLDCDLSPFIDQYIFREGLDHYAAALKANPGSRARIIVGRTGLYTAARERRKLVSLILGRLVKNHRIRRNRIMIRFINSGSAGLYIVPKSTA